MSFTRPTKAVVPPDKLTDSQKECIRQLLRGFVMYVDHRDKFRLTEKSLTNPSNDETLRAGHGNNHLYRPTAVFFIDEKIVKSVQQSYFKRETIWEASMPLFGCSELWIINDDYKGKFKEEIDYLRVTAALGEKRSIESERFE